MGGNRVCKGLGRFSPRPSTVSGGGGRVKSSQRSQIFRAALGVSLQRAAEPQSFPYPTTPTHGTLNARNPDSKRLVLVYCTTRSTES